MLWSFAGNPIYLVFSSSPGSGGPACRVLGPYALVEFRAMGLWAHELGQESIRIATREKDSLCWDLDGIDDHKWGSVKVVSPSQPTSAREIEAANDWIRPD